MATIAATVTVAALMPTVTAPAAAEGFGPAGTMMLGLEEGAAAGTTTELVGWGLSAIGLDNEQGQESQEIVDDLNEISDQLTDISDELSTLNSEITNQTCTLETSDTTNAAVSQISTWSVTLQDYLGAAVNQNGGASNLQVEELVEDILDDDTGAAYQLSVINTALLDEGIADGIISSCLATLATPTSGTAGDLTYYDAVANLTMYFYTVQVQGLNLLVEALHAEATEAWVQANGAAALDPADAPMVCSDAPNITVLDYCNQATGWMTLIYENVQQQFAFAGAPYSVYTSGSTTAYDVATLNGTPYAFVTSLESFTTAQGASCPTPLTSADPCGPLVGTNLTTSIPQAETFGYRTNWTPASAEVWQDVLNGWSDSSQTLGSYLADTWDFQNTAGVTKVFLTNTTYTADPDYGGEQAKPFSLPAVCFGDTSAARSIGHEPFCYNGSNNGEDYGEASDVLEQHWLSDPDLGCANYYAPSALTDEDTDGFYDYLYADPLDGYTCPTGEGWEDGDLPGWVLGDDGASDEQYLWPMFDMSSAACNVNDNGSSRSTTNAAGVYTMCGDDFDAWFATIVPDPADNVPTTTTTTSTTSTSSTTASTTTTTSSAPTASVSPTTVTAGDTVTITTSGWDATATVTTTLYSDPVKLDQSAVDASGRLTRTVTIPASTEAGAHALHLDGTYHRSAYELVVPITVRAPTGTSRAVAPTTGTLPATGTRSVPVGAVGVGLVVGGAAALALARRRRHPGPPT